MWFFLGLFLTIALADTEASCSTSVSPGVFSYTVGSTATTGYLIQAGGANSWGPVTPSGSQVTVGLGPRFYLANSCASSFGPTVFSADKLLGGSISFTVDISKIGCGLNAAFYLVSMPGSGAGSNRDYYCDANAVGGNPSCSEMDLFEANRHAIQITPHRCSGSSCDTGGCARNTQSITKGFGPDSTFTINSASVFTVKITFNGNPLTSITSVISQGSKSITLTHDSSCGSGYLSTVGTALGQGMVPVWSYWSGNVAWLDSPACSSESPEVTGSFILSNLIVGGTVASTVGTPPPPPPPPGSVICGTSGVTININYVEFKAPAGLSPIPNTASIKCNDGSTWACNWYAAGSKYQCPCSGATGCPQPATPTINGKTCVLSSSAALSDSTAETNSFGSDQPLIIGLSVGIAVTVLVILVLIVIVFIRKQTGNTETV